MVLSNATFAQSGNSIPKKIKMKKHDAQHNTAKHKTVHQLCNEKNADQIWHGDIKDYDAFEQLMPTWAKNKALVDRINKAQMNGQNSDDKKIEANAREISKEQASKEKHDEAFRSNLHDILEKLRNGDIDGIIEKVKICRKDLKKEEENFHD
jgi:hypothetical protein